MKAITQGGAVTLLLPDDSLAGESTVDGLARALRLLEKRQEDLLSLQLIRLGDKANTDDLNKAVLEFAQQLATLRPFAGQTAAPEGEGDALSRHLLLKRTKAEGLRALLSRAPLAARLADATKATLATLSEKVAVCSLLASLLTDKTEHGLPCAPGDEYQFLELRAKLLQLLARRCEGAEDEEGLSCVDVFFSKAPNIQAALLKMRECWPQLQLELRRGGATRKDGGEAVLELLVAGSLVLALLECAREIRSGAAHLRTRQPAWTYQLLKDPGPGGEQFVQWLFRLGLDALKRQTPDARRVAVFSELLLPLGQLLVHEHVEHLQLLDELRQPRPPEAEICYRSARTTAINALHRVASEAVELAAQSVQGVQEGVVDAWRDRVLDVYHLAEDADDHEALVRLCDAEPWDDDREECLRDYLEDPAHQEKFAAVLMREYHRQGKFSLLTDLTRGGHFNKALATYLQQQPDLDGVAWMHYVVEADYPRASESLKAHTDRLHAGHLENGWLLGLEKLALLAAGAPRDSAGLTEVNKKLQHHQVAQLQGHVSQHE